MNLLKCTVVWCIASILQRKNFFLAFRTRNHRLWNRKNVVHSILLLARKCHFRNKKYIACWLSTLSVTNGKTFGGLKCMQTRILKYSHKHKSKVELELFELMINHFFFFKYKFLFKINISEKIVFLMNSVWILMLFLQSSL